MLISARVHPGEVPASHVMNGVLSYLTDPENRAIIERFVFFLVPMINPDGVFRGHWRVDSVGQNLNRFYLNPSEKLQPGIFAMDQLVMRHQQSL